MKTQESAWQNAEKCVCVLPTEANTTQVGAASNQSVYSTNGKSHGRSNTESLTIEMVSRHTRTSTDELFTTS
jgi:hypothetical protein